MWVDKTAKAKIMSETDPEIIFENFKKYTGNDIGLEEDSTPEEIETNLFIIKRATVGHIEFIQGECKPFEEVAANLRKYIKEKSLNGTIQNNNETGCRKRSN